MACDKQAAILRLRCLMSASGVPLSTLRKDDPERLDILRRCRGYLKVVKQDENPVLKAMCQAEPVMMEAILRKMYVRSSRVRYASTSSSSSSSSSSLQSLNSSLESLIFSSSSSSSSEAEEAEVARCVRELEEWLEKQQL